MSRPAHLRVLALVTAGLAACTPTDQVAEVVVKVVRGTADPLEVAAAQGQPAASIGSIAVRLVSDGQPAVSHEVALGASRSITLDFAVPPATGSRIVIRGQRDGDKSVYSAGRSVPFDSTVGSRVEVPVFFGPVDSFTPIVGTLPGPRQGPAVAALGDTGALLVGGYETTATGVHLASPSLVVYRLGEPLACGLDEGCVQGSAIPPPRRFAVAVALSDGTVLHGLGLLANGQPDASLYLTRADGSTELLVLTGDAVPALYGAAAVALADGTVLLFGGDTGASPVSSVYRVDIAARTSTLEVQRMAEPRRFAGAARLSTGQVLLVGGENSVGPSDTAELYKPGQPSRVVDGGAFSKARSVLLGPRVAPSLAVLAGDSVVIAGGGPEAAEVFRLDLGAAVGGFIDVTAPPTELKSKAPALLRLSSGELLLVGGEAEGTAAPRASAFTPATRQVFDDSSPTFVGSYRRIGPGATLRANPALVTLSDGSVLLAGGGTLGVTASPTAANPGAAPVEILVPAPLE